MNDVFNAFDINVVDVCDVNLQIEREKFLSEYFEISFYKNVCEWILKFIGF